MGYIGVDLAWGQNSTTGLAAVDEQGRLVEMTRARTDCEILAWLELVTAGPCLVAIDAPIVVRNATGSRPCERLVGKYFGRFGASCHSSNTTNAAFASGTRALRLAGALGLDIDPGSRAERRAIEVYPHPAIVVLFELPSVLRYKAKPGRDMGLLRAELLRLLDFIESLEADEVPLRVRDCAAWRQVRESVEVSATKAALGQVEDSIDAVVCAHIARLAEVCPGRVRVLGTVSDGYILTPVTPQIAAKIDSDHRSSSDTGRAAQGSPVPEDPPVPAVVAVPERFRSLLAKVAERCWQEPDLEAFLGWRGATLEYWVQMVFAAVASREMWAAQGETPLITACPSANAKTSEKWADGALMWPDGVGALVEIKSVPASRRRRMQDVVFDLAALLAIDWPATVQRPGPDAGVDERWWEVRHNVVEPWALSIALVHGPAPVEDPVIWMPSQLNAGLASLRHRFPDDPPCAARTAEALSQPIFQSEWTGQHHEAVVLAWAAPPPRSEPHSSGSTTARTSDSGAR